MKANYKIRRIKSSSDTDVTEALKIYSNNIEPELRTDSRQILHWLDFYGKEYKDQFLIIILYLDNQLVGYSQMVHFTEEKVVFVDYIVLDPLFRTNNVFYEFVHQIELFLKDKNLSFDYIFAEVGILNATKDLSEKHQLIVRLLKLSGFKVVVSNYYAPSLQAQIQSNENKSILMIFTENKISGISKNIYIQLLELIYFKHYFRWYKEFFTEIELIEYGEDLKSKLEKTKSDLRSQDEIKINGHSNYFSSKEKYKKYYKINPILIWFSSVIIFIVLVILFGFIHVFVKSRFNIDADAQYYIVLASVSVIFLVVLLFTENRTKWLAKLLREFLF